MAPAAPLYPNWEAGMPMMIPQDQNMSFAGFTHPNVQAAYLNAMQPQPFPQFAFPQPGGAVLSIIFVLPRDLEG